MWQVKKFYWDEFFYDPDEETIQFYSVDGKVTDMGFEMFRQQYFVEILEMTDGPRKDGGGKKNN